MDPTAHIHTFRAAGLRRLIAAARRAAAFPDDRPEGWHKSPVDPRAVLDVFTTLRLKPGYTLRAYAFREGGNGNAFVYAVPVEASFLEPADCRRDTGRFLDPPVPPGALPDVMGAIDGDRSPLAYISASLFAREIREFGALWHGCEWSTHTILGANPFERPANAFEMTTEADQWTWIEPKPESWLPTAVAVEPRGVRFYTHSALHSERIVRHVDSFERNSYVFETDETDIARGPGGFVF